MAPLIAGIELGGTKAIACLARGPEIVAMTRLATGEPGATLDALSMALAGWTAAHGVPAALGIGSFGPVDLNPASAGYGRITATPKPGWRDTDVVEHFARGFDGRIGFDTDVAGAALAERMWGAAQGCVVVAYVTIGTGIGMGLVVDGVPVHGLVHPEAGHVGVRRAGGDGFAGVCPFHGDCIEGLASGPAIAARAGVADAADLADDHPVWELVTRDVGEWLASVMLTVSPERIVLGGGVFGGRAALFPAIRARTAAALGGYVAGVDAARLAEVIRAPGLGERAGPLGAVAIGLRALG